MLNRDYDHKGSVAKKVKKIVIEVLTAVDMKSTNFSDIKPCSPLSVNRLFGGTYRLYLQGSSETSVDTLQTTRRYVPKYGTLQIKKTLVVSLERLGAKTN
jgi:hypothetical protein